MMKFGFAALAGRPNVGKSTLVNALAGTKVTIVSRVAQTTRTPVRGVVTTAEAQVCFVDTPGIHKPVTLLGERLNQTARRQFSDVDMVIAVYDAAGGIGRGDAVFTSFLPDDKPVLCVLNKIDLVSRAEIAQQLKAARDLRDFACYVPLSAQSGDGVDLLMDEVMQRLPEGAAMFPPDMATDQTERHLVAELVREQFLHRTLQEVPHSVAVFVDDLTGLDEPDGMVRAECTIYVERNSQKGIVIGQGGTLLRDAGTAARKQLEGILGRRVYLGLRVRVSRKWQRRAEIMERLGY